MKNYDCVSLKLSNVKMTVEDMCILLSVLSNNWKIKRKISNFRLNLAKEKVTEV